LARARGGCQGETLYECEKVFEKTGSPSERDKLPSFHAKKIGRDAEEVLESMSNILEDPKEFIECNVQCTVVGVEGHNLLKQKLDNSAYSKDNFIGFKKSSTPAASFIVCFKGGKELGFPNRASTNSALRGALLKDALENGVYANLRGLISQERLTEKDAMFKYVLAPTKNNFYVPLDKNALWDKQKLFTLNRELASTKVGNTTLAKLWGISID